MTTQMTDAEHTGRSICKRQYRRERRRDLPCRGQVEITKTMHMAVATHLAIPHAVLFGERDARAHAFQISRQQSTGLGGLSRPVRYAHRASGDQSRAEERRRIRQVRFDDHAFRQLQRGMADSPDARLLISGRIAARAVHISDGHADMRQARRLLPRMPQLQPTGQARPDQQQTGDEL